MSSEELKPCPFCGGTAEEDNNEYGAHWIACRECGARSGGEMFGRDTIAEKWNTRAQLAAIQGGMGEAVDNGYKPDARIMQTLANLATRKPLHNLQAIGEARSQISIRQLDSMLHEAGCDLADYAFTLRQDFDALHAQHQRITAAMAAEVERLREERDSCRDMAGCMDIFRKDMIERGVVGEQCPPMFMTEGVCSFIGGIMRERDALRAELAEVKGREAVPVAWRVSVAGEWEIGTDREKVQFQRDLFERVMSDETEHEEAEPLYASPPASPDVEGLVKALEADFPLLDDNGLDETLHHCEWNIQQERKRLQAALSTWRQAHTPSTLPASSAEE